MPTKSPSDTHPPTHLRQASKALWATIAAKYDLEPSERELLRTALEALDRGAEARDQIAKDGAYLTDRFGQVRAHPAVGVERDCAIRAARLFRELRLEEDTPDDVRLPRRRGGAPGSGHSHQINARRGL